MTRGEEDGRYGEKREEESHPDNSPAAAGQLRLCQVTGDYNGLGTHVINVERDHKFRLHFYNETEFFLLISWLRINMNIMYFIFWSDTS